MTRSPQTPDLTNAASARHSVGRLVRQFWISARWQYRRPIFFRAVVKLAAQDIGIACLLILGGLLAPVVIVLAFPVRLMVWAAQPIFAPFTKATDAAWLAVASQLNRRDPPNAEAEVTRKKGSE